MYICVCIYLVGASVANLRDKSLKLGNEISDLVISDIVHGNSTRLPRTGSSARHIWCQREQERNNINTIADSLGA